MNSRNIQKVIIVFLLVLNIALIIAFLVEKMQTKYSNTDNTKENVIAEENKVELNTEVSKNYSNAETYENSKMKKVYKYKKGKQLSEHTITNYGSWGNRNVNLDVACKIIDSNYKKKKGFFLKPGKKFDWYEVIGDTTASKGFLTAGVIINNQHAEALGGGVCQIASTLNSAAIKAGLKTKCVKHSVDVGYLGPQDYEATVAYSPNKENAKNLVIKNTKDFSILIKAKAEGQTVTVKIYKMKKYLDRVEFIPKKF